MYEVLEFAGMHNERQEAEFTTHREAREYIQETYTPDEIDQMPVDITFNGSTEY